MEVENGLYDYYCLIGWPRNYYGGDNDAAKGEIVFAGSDTESLVNWGWRRAA